MSSIAPGDRAAGPTARTVFALAWPMTLKAVILHGTVVIDAYLVSALGETSLAAMGLAAAVAGLVLGAIFAFSGAMQIRAAQAFGSGDRVFIKSVLAVGLTISLVIGVVGLIFVWIFGRPILDALAPDAQVAALAWRYLAVFSLVILGEAIGQCLSSFFNGCGDTKIPLISFCLSLPLNIGISVVLIHGHLGMPALGVMGAAIGSAVAIAAQVAFLGLQLVLRNGDLARVAGWHRGSFAMALRRHIVFSLPICATFFSASLSGQVCTLIYAKMSLNSFAALTLIVPWNMVAGQISMQWAQATGIIVAQLLGQRAPEAELDRFLSAAWRGAFVTAAVVAIVFVVMCLSVDRLYANLSIETRAILAGFLPLLLVLPFPRATNAICGNTLRASGDTVYVMHIFLWSQWLFRVPATALAVLVFNLSAVWVLCILLGEEMIKLPAFHRRLFQGRWKEATVAE